MNNCSPTYTQRWRRSKRAVQLNCKPVASYFLSDRGKHGSGRNHHQRPQECADTNNLSFLHPRSVTRNSPPRHLKSGVVKENVELAIDMCMERVPVNSKWTSSWISLLYLHRRDGTQACFGVFAYRSIIGLVEPEQLTYEALSAVSSQEDAEILSLLKERQFAPQALEVRVASLDNKVGFPIGVFYIGTKEEHTSLNNCTTRYLTWHSDALAVWRQIWTVRFIAKNASVRSSFFDSCAKSGYTEWHPLLRPCGFCMREDKVCTRLFLLVWVTDCDPKQKSFMNSMLADRVKYPHQVPIPDCPHNIKSVRSAEFWHWIDMDG